MTSSSISVAMCTYNGAAFVGEQLESLLRQTRQPDELVVCDDGSSDNTTGIVAEFARRAAFRVRIVAHKSNLGISANYEHAISLCTGDLVFLCDQDDVWDADKIASTAAVLDASPEASGAFSDSEVVDSNLGSKGYSLWDACAFTAAARRAFPEHAVEALLEGNKVQGAALAFRASCRSMLLPISPRWAYDAWLGIVLAACGLVPIERKLMQYRQHELSSVGAEMRPKVSRLRRQLRKFGRLQHYYSEKLEETDGLLRQLDDLEARLSSQAERFSKALASVAERRRRLEQRRRRSARWGALLQWRT